MNTTTTVPVGNAASLGFFLRVALSTASLAAPLACTADVSPMATEDTASAVAAVSLASSSGRDLDPETRFFVPSPNPGAVEQALTLVRGRHLLQAASLGVLAATPHAVWFVGGTPEEVRLAVQSTMAQAARERRVPVLVTYNIPYRDCAGYSAGGAHDTDSYQAWIDAFAAGIGDGKALVIVEPDSLGIIPNNTTIYGSADWCHPTVTDAAGVTVPDPAATPGARYTQLNYAVDRIVASAPRTSVFLDGTHSAWLGVGESAFRLVQAGVGRAQGFYLNVSNYEPTDQNTLFGTWVSDCITAATTGLPAAAGHFDWCPSQYNADAGFARDYSPVYAARVTLTLAALMNGSPATTKFVIDTGRNGRGAWQPTSPSTYPDAQTWCNAPGRGAGNRPTAATGNALLSAYLWIKTPGESDGSCNRGVEGSLVDPEWGGIVDPAAGAWFGAQALELAARAEPPLF